MPILRRRLCQRLQKPRHDRSDAGTGVKLEIAGGEFVEGSLVPEQDDLRIILGAQLKADTELVHHRFADASPLRIDMSFAARTADQDANLADIGEHGIAIAIFEELGASACTPEQNAELLMGFSIKPCRCLKFSPIF